MATYTISVTNKSNCYLYYLQDNTSGVTRKTISLNDDFEIVGVVPANVENYEVTFPDSTKCGVLGVLKKYNLGSVSNGSFRAYSVATSDNSMPTSDGMSSSSTNANEKTITNDNGTFNFYIIGNISSNGYFSTNNAFEWNNNVMYLYYRYNLEYASTQTTDDTSIKTVTYGNVTIETASATDCTYTYTPNSPTTNDDITLTFTANDGYYFAEDIYITDGTNIYTATISSDNLTATYTWNHTDSESDITLRITAIAKLKAGNVTIVESTVENCTYTVTPTDPTTDDTIVIVFTPNDNYHFSVTPYVTAQNQGYMSNTITAVANGDGSYTATITFSESTSATINLYAYAITSTSGSTGYLFTIFKIDEQNMQDIASARYINLSTGEIVDLGDYINTLKKFYCSVPTSTNKQSILLGTYKIDTQAVTVTDEIFDIDCGEIKIASINNNATDYDISATAYLPFIGMVNLDGDKIMGRTLRLVYTVSSINGTCIGNLISNNSIIATFEGNIGIDLPYILAQTEGRYRGNVNSNNNILYGFVPKIFVYYHENYNENGKIAITDNRYARIGDLTDFNAIEDVDFTGVDIPSDEIDMLEEILKNGIIVS